MTLSVAGPVRFGRVRDRAAGVPAGYGVPADAGATGERAGLVLALAAHVALFALLSLAWGAQPPRAWPKPQPIEVSLVKDVALEATAPPAPTPPAASVAPDVGPPEEAAPPPPPVPVAKPEPVKPAPAKPAPAKPAPAKPETAKPAPRKPEPKVEPEPAPKPVAKPAPKPAPAPKPVPAAKPAAAKPAPSKPAAAKTMPTKASVAKAAARPSRLAGLFPSIAAGAKADATASRARGRRLGDEILAGLSPDAPAKKAATAAPGAKPGPYPTASIVQAIARQIQPCADRQVNPGPGANRIVTTLNIRLNEDGTLAATPRMVRQAGITDENERYAQRVTDLGIAAFKGCTPLKLPAEYYSTPSGGWGVINYQWQLR